MITNIDAGQTAAQAAQDLLGSDWMGLAQLVQNSQPDVVVLIARKMPRLAELLGLRFGENCKVISDLAVPYSTDELAGARVAIVDDIVNVGTTMARANQASLAAGAIDTRMFALARRNSVEPMVSPIR